MFMNVIHYIAVFLLLAYAYHRSPILILKNEFIFIGLGMLVFHYLFTFICAENFDANLENTEPVNKEVEVIDSNKQNNIQEDSELVLTDLEILNHIQNIISNSNNRTMLASILKACQEEENIDKRYALLSIYELTVANPILTSKVATSSPQRVLELADLIRDIPDIKQSLEKTANATTDTLTVNAINKKISLLENIIAGSSGDMKYSQIDPEMYKPPVRKEDDEWDTTGYVLMDPSVWRPRIEENINRYQEDECPVCPSLTPGYPVNLMEFDKSRYVLPPDNISVDYIKKLNSKKF